MKERGQISTNSSGFQSGSWTLLALYHGWKLLLDSKL